MRNLPRIAQNPSKPRAQEATKVGETEVGDVGIKGITIVIHLEGREDLVIRANLSPRLRG
jgi:hypothetical protein